MVKNIYIAAYSNKSWMSGRGKFGISEKIQRKTREFYFEEFCGDPV